MSSLVSQNFRRYIVTASIAAVTVTGAVYGAGLKSRQEFKQEQKEVLQATSVEKIEQLEATKSRLLRQKMELQAKIDRLTAKQSIDAQQAANSNG